MRPLGFAVIVNMPYKWLASFVLHMIIIYLFLLLYSILYLVFD